MLRQEEEASSKTMSIIKEEAKDDAKEKPPKSCWDKFMSFWRHLTLEPAYMMFAMGMGVYYIVAAELYIEKVCRVNLNYTDEVCDNIHDHRDKQVTVQKYVSTLKIYSTVLQAIPGILLCVLYVPNS